MNTHYSYLKNRYGSAVHSILQDMAVEDAAKRMRQQQTRKQEPTPQEREQGRRQRPSRRKSKANNRIPKPPTSGMNEEIVNSSNAGSMTKAEIKKRDKTAKKVKPKPIKGDTEKESRYRIATYITLRARGGKKNK